MATLLSFFVFCQALGALIGACTAVWSEIAYVRAMRDGKLDIAERAHIHVIASGLRFGMFLLLLSSLGLVIVSYILATTPQPVLTESYWTSITLTFLIIGISWALSRHRVSFALGSAIIFTAWWFLAYLTLGQLPPLSFGAAAALLVLSTAIFYTVLQYGRFFMLDRLTNLPIQNHLAQKVKSL